MILGDNMRMNKEQLIDLIESLGIDYEEFWILSSSALVLRDLFDDAGDLDIAVTEKGLEQLKSKYDLKQKENGWYIVNDKVECMLDEKLTSNYEKVGKYNLESLPKYFKYLQSSTREKDKIRYEIVKKQLEYNDTTDKKTIEICEGYGAAGVLKKAEEDNDNIRIPFNLCLSIGDLKGLEDYERCFLSLLGNEYFEPDFKENINLIYNEIEKGSKIRIWTSHRSNDDYLLFLYMCDLLKDKVDFIYVVYSDEYNEHCWTLSCMDYLEVRQLFSKEHKLSKNEINEYAKKWQKIRQINSELRIVNDNEIQNLPFSHYDEEILSRLKQKGECTIASLVAELMGNLVINDMGDLEYLYLIDILIKKNKIKIIEKGERHFLDKIVIESK